MRRFLATSAFSILCLSSFAQTDAFREELLNLASLSRLPVYRDGDMEQLSSWDRTGGNDEGFSGKYSAIRKEKEGLVNADLKGPGIIIRIWTPTPEMDTIKFYFDGETTPRISLPFIQLFTGKQFPFIAPLCGNQLGGYFCFMPIPYERSLKIVYTGNNLRFHQTQYRSLPATAAVTSFNPEMVGKNMDLINRISDLWSRKASPLDAYRSTLKSKKINLALRSGTVNNLFKMTSGGRIVGIEFGAGSDLLQAYRKINLMARWDGEKQHGINLPLHDFFGFAFGKPAMQSFILGADKSKLYSYLPMPFSSAADISLAYTKKAATDPDELFISGTIYYTDSPLDPAREGRFYVQSRRQYNIPQGTPHTIADVQGKGHYIGTVLVTQGLENGSTYYFEGDDITTVDGQMKFHGTGSEDYFNGGYYAVMDKWDMKMSLPTHGAIAYDMATSRTGGYRFYLSDKPSFTRSFNLTIEHQPEDKIQVKTDYHSMGMFYASKPVFHNTSLLLDSSVQPVAYRHRLTPQGMVFSLYWHATADYQDPAIIFGLKRKDTWNQNVDIDAVPMAQVSLHQLDNGRYRVWVEHGGTEKGSDFSLWQRSSQVSGWIPTNISLPGDGTTTVHAGEIEITDELKTITVRKRKTDDAGSVKIFAFQFEKIN